MARTPTSLGRGRSALAEAARGMVIVGSGGENEMEVGREDAMRDWRRGEGVI